MNITTVIVRAQDTGLFLFQHREDKATIGNPGLWTLLGGFMEEDEDPEEGAMREVEEESGIQLPSVRYLGTCTITVVYKDGRAPVPCEMRTYTGEVAKQVTGELKPGREFRWMTLADFAKLPSPTGMAAFITAHADDIAK